MSTFIAPVELRRGGLLLTPLGPEHAEGLAAAAADGELWQLRYTSVPEPGREPAYIAHALEQRAAGSRLAFAVIDEPSGTLLGRRATTTSSPRSAASRSATPGIAPPYSART